MGGIAIIVHFDVPPENRARFDALLRQSVEETLADDGCLRMEILRPQQDNDLIILSELWRDRASIDKHRQKPGHDDGHRALEALASAKRVFVCDVLA